MENRTRNGLITLGVIAGGAAATVLAARWAWRRRTNTKIARMRAVVAPERLLPYEPGELDGLPENVQRFFERVLPRGYPQILWAHIHQVGKIRQSELEPWRDFVAAQDFTSHPPGFVWDASIPVLPGLSIMARDSYSSGRGEMDIRVTGLIPLAHEEGRLQMGEATLQRYLCEAVWFPTALLPSAGVKWTAIDEHWARATLHDCGATASVDFRFGLEDTIVEAYVQSRYQAVNGGYVARPWRGKYWRYERRNDVLIPLNAQVAWVMDDGDFVYWRGAVRDIAYDVVV